MKKGKWDGRRVKELREKAGLTQAELASYLGVKQRQRVLEFEADHRMMNESKQILMDVLEAAINKEPIERDIDDVRKVWFKPVVVKKKAK